MASPMEASSSSSKPVDVVCGQCSQAVAKYTCPGCSTKTCSLPCSKAHKQAASCSGVRNPASYVPMNAYSYGALMSDYTFLEDLGRKSDVVKKERGDDGKGQKARDRERTLKSEMHKAGFGGVRWLSDGMEARKLNQTKFNPKTHSLQLTISLETPNSTTSSKLVHSLAPSHLLSSLPALLASTATSPLLLLLPHPTSSPSQPAFYAPSSTVKSDKLTLSDAMRDRSWIEYPKFQLWAKDVWDAALEKGEVKVAEAELDLPETAEGVKQRVWGKRAREDGDEEGEEDGRPEEKKVLLGAAVDEGERSLEEDEAALEMAKVEAIQEVLGLAGMLGEYGSDEESGED